MTSLSIIIVNKTGEVEELNIKKYNSDDLYKKCGFKKNDHFNLQHTWTVDMNGIVQKILLYAKTFGKANTENKYEFPPPADNKLYYGKCALVLTSSNNKEIDLDMDTWTKIYETLFGGFEDINNVAQDEDDDDELEDIPSNMKTKAGAYLKDGFVVDNESDVEEDEEEECYETNETNETNEINSADVSSKDGTDDDDGVDFDDHGSELSEEEYIFSEDE